MGNKSGLVGRSCASAAKLLGGLAVALMLIAGGRQDAKAGLVTFDDLTIGGAVSASSFFGQGIAGSYEGFLWGESSTPGLGSANIPMSGFSGWGSATVANPATGTGPAPVSGTSYAWTWAGRRSLFIDFQAPHDVASGYFATLDSAFGSNASTVQMFGYDSSDALVASSSVLNLSDSFQQLNAGFTNVNILEIRSNAGSSWFTIDDLDVSPSSISVVPVPEPTTALGLLGLVTSAFFRRRRRLLG